MDVDRVAELQRRQDAGAVWEVFSRTGRSVTIGLLRCDGGEEVDRSRPTIGACWPSSATGQQRGPTRDLEIGKLTALASLHGAEVPAITKTGWPVRQRF